MRTSQKSKSPPQTYEADYHGASPEQVAAALLKYRPARPTGSQKPKPASQAPKC